MGITHSKAAGKYLADTEKSEWHDQTLWRVRMKRDFQAKGLDDWEMLREQASQIKVHTLRNLDAYLEEFVERARGNGIIVHRVKDACEFNETVLSILKERGVSKLVKSKSMLTEECEMNPFLEANGIEVVETDLGEYIIQQMNMRPSHIVMPAIHLTKEEVGELFVDKLGSEEGNNDPTYLTHCARRHLRKEFLTAGAGMTGVNFAVADTGEIVVCTNEGNADLCASVPKLHIAVMGMEKVIPDLKSLAFFHRLLARSATGQPSTAFTSHFRKPRPGSEMHVIIVDNWRSAALKDPDHWQTLKCIRCGACMNTCPVYRRSGGYSYSYFVPGPVGINLGMLNGPKVYSGNVSACSLCKSCDNVCPVKVNLSEQIYLWRQDLDRIGSASNIKKILSGGMTYMFDRPSLYRSAVKTTPLLDSLVSASEYLGLHLWGKGRRMPELAKEPFHRIWEKGELQDGK